MVKNYITHHTRVALIHWFKNCRTGSGGRVAIGNTVYCPMKFNTLLNIGSEVGKFTTFYIVANEAAQSDFRITTRKVEMG